MPWKRLPTKLSKENIVKVTFIQPYYQNIWESLGIAYIGSYCKKHYKGKLEMSFFQGYFDNDETIIEGCKNSDIVAFSCTSPTINRAESLAKRIRELNKKVKIVVGGWHVTATHHKPEWADQVIIGEGEKPFLSILEGDDRTLLLGEKLDFSELPHPDRKLIKNERTIDLCNSMIGLKIASFQANRGCPMNCAYCAEACMTGKLNRKYNPIRSRNAKDICDEIEQVIKEYKIDYFKFVDATFDVSEEFVEAFVEEKIKRRIDTPWECLVHANFATEKMMELLKASDCNQINIGCESGSPDILKDIRKGVTVEKIKQVFEWAKKNEIKRRAFFILGMPNETEDDLRMTEKLADELNADVVGFTILCPYPGCDFYNKETMANINWQETDEYSNDFWHSKNLSNSDLKRWQKYLTEKYKNKVCERQK